MPNVLNAYKDKVNREGASATTANKYHAMLLTACYAFPLAGASLDDDTVTAFLAGTPAELGVSGYVRKALTGGAYVGPDDTNDRATTQFQKASFDSLATGEIVVAAAILWLATPAAVGGGNDSADLVASAYSLTNTPTNGGTIEVRWGGTDGVGDAIHLG